MSESVDAGDPGVGCGPRLDASIPDGHGWAAAGIRAGFSSADGISTPAICFEWLVVEAFARRLDRRGFPPAVPGSQKARGVVGRSQRLSAATYLKGPTVFGFNGVYKPFAVDSGVVGLVLEPGVRCAELLRRWERDQGFDGFTDGVRGRDGGRLRAQIRDEVRAALRAGRCTTSPGSWLFGRLASSLRPDEPGSAERGMLRALLTGGEHETRSELAGRVSGFDPTLSEALILEAVRPTCSAWLGRIIDAVVAYERFAALLDAAFRTLCSVSHSSGTQPMTVDQVRGKDMIVRCAVELPSAYERAAEAIAAVTPDIGLEDRLGEFAIGRAPAELVQLILTHHEQVQAAKPPNGKRPWFEPLRDGWVVRAPYGSPEQPRVEEVSDGDEVAGSRLPSGFVDCLVDPGPPAGVQLALDLPGLPSAWEVEDPAGALLLDADAWLAAGAAPDTRVALPPGPLPAYLMVHWADPSGGGEATWTANVADRGALPPPAELAGSLDALQWRLHGVFGPLALADGFVAAASKDQALPGDRPRVATSP